MPRTDRPNDDEKVDRSDTQHRIEGLRASLSAPEDIVIIVFIESLSAGNLWRLSNEGGFVESYVKEANLQSIVAD